MKFLIALSILASSSVFAHNNNFNRIKCYEPFDQGERPKVAYVFEERGMGDQVLHLVYPEGLPNPLKLDNEGCLEHPSVGPGPSNEVTFCPTTGQSIRGLFPVEVTVGGEIGSDTVYCQRDLEDWFEDDAK